MIELMLYVSLSAIILLSIVFFILTSINGRIKHETITQVQQQGLQVTQEITQTLRNAVSINNPVSGSEGNILSIEVAEGDNTPTVFDLSGNSIQMTEGSKAALDLTHFPIIASNLTFKNLSSSNSPGSIRFEFTLTHHNPEGKNEYDYTKTFSASASLRQNE